MTVSMTAAGGENRRGTPPADEKRLSRGRRFAQVHSAADAVAVAIGAAALDGAAADGPWVHLPPGVGLRSGD